MGVGHTIIALDYGATIKHGLWESRAHCDARSCKHWMTCTVSKHCQRGQGRTITEPKVEAVVNRECGDIMLVCRSYVDRPDLGVFSTCSDTEKGGA